MATLPRSLTIPAALLSDSTQRFHTCLGVRSATRASGHPNYSLVLMTTAVPADNIFDNKSEALDISLLDMGDNNANILLCHSITLLKYTKWHIRKKQSHTEQLKSVVDTGFIGANLRLNEPIKPA